MEMITYRMKKNRTTRGFALLVALIFVSVMLAFGAALSSLGYKQLILASDATRSQYAFYAADSAIECALLEVQKPEGSNQNIDDPYSYGAYSPKFEPTNCWGLKSALPTAFTELCGPGTSACPSDPNLRVTRKRFEFVMTGAPTGTCSNLPVGDYRSTCGTTCADVTVYEKAGKTAGSTVVYAQGYDVKCSNVASTNIRIVTRGLFVKF